MVFFDFLILFRLQLTSSSPGFRMWMLCSAQCDDVEPCNHSTSDSVTVVFGPRRDCMRFLLSTRWKQCDMSRLLIRPITPFDAHHIVTVACMTANVQRGTWTNPGKFFVTGLSLIYCSIADRLIFAAIVHWGRISTSRLWTLMRLEFAVNGLQMWTEKRTGPCLVR